MEYSASAMKYSFWFVETRETVRMLQDHSAEEVRNIVIKENIYQQRDRSRTINEYGCINRRLEAISDKLKALLLKADVSTAKLIVLISAMASDRLFFELMYDVYRRKLYLGEEELKNSDWSVFIRDRADQSELVAGWTEGTIKRIKSSYTRYLLDAGLIRKEGARRKLITRPYIEPELRQILLQESMDDYLNALTGEQ